MATHELRNRSNWQTISGAKALKTEDVFRKSLQQALDEVHPNMFKIDKHPRDFSSIYSRYELPHSTLKKIYNIDMSDGKQNSKPKYNWGITMDFAIRNIHSGKTLFGEIKRQDGWVKTQICRQEGEMHTKGVANTSLQV